MERLLGEYLRGELDQLAARPTLDEMLERVATRAPVDGEPASEIIRREHKERDAIWSSSTGARSPIGCCRALKQARPWPRP